jgi:hypothetical protein
VYINELLFCKLEEPPSEMGNSSYKREKKWGAKQDMDESCTRGKRAGKGLQTLARLQAEQGRV